MKRIIACTAATVLLAVVTAASAAPTPAELCSAAVELASSKFAACRMKAESTFFKTGLAEKRTADLGKCATKFLDAFAKAETRYGVDCPMVEAKEDFEAYLVQCSDDTTAALGGAPLPSYTESDCGNGSIDAPEQCDGANLNAASCLSLGFPGGTLGCSAGCGFDVSGCAPAALTQSGQTTCWDSAGALIACAGTGHDGDLQSGATTSLTDNGDGTITDNNTRLMWEKLDDNDVGGIHDKDNFYTWDDAYAVKIATLNTPPCFASHCDWRVPNIRELQSIAKYEVLPSGPSVPAAFDSDCAPGCTACSCTVPDVHWTSTTYVGSPDFAWYVFFVDGSVLANQKTNGGYVRAVRTVP
ncbi:MAG: DUF1566 domain-containing protein [Deltaproteobacteria bacterium]|nr:DUF1566 domain-containing protein [Deltaproteobacteria bacterium]